MRVEIVGACSVCGQRVRSDTIHTCSPQVAAPTGTTGSGSDATSDVRMAALRERAKRGVGLYGPGDIKDCFTVIDRERTARIAAEQRAEESRAAIFEWHQKNLALQRSVNLLQRQNRELRGIAEKALAELANVDRGWHDHAQEYADVWPEEYEANGMIAALRSRLADIDKGEG